VQAIRVYSNCLDILLHQPTVSVKISRRYGIFKSDINYGTIGEDIACSAYLFQHPASCTHFTLRASCPSTRAALFAEATAAPIPPLTDRQRLLPLSVRSSRRQKCGRTGEPEAGCTLRVQLACGLVVVCFGPFAFPNLTLSAPMWIVQPQSL